MVVLFYVFFCILCVQCPQTMDQVWIAALCADAENDGYGEVCPNGQMPWPFFCALEWGQDAAGGTTESMAESGREWAAEDG
jgi:hypothetical protein